MTHYTKEVIIKKWVPILEEYERIKAKQSKHLKRVKDLLELHHIGKKELHKRYRRWVASGKKPDSLLPMKRGPRRMSRRTPKDVERNFVKAYRKLGYNRYELVLLFKPYYLDKTPAPATVERIKKRYPLNDKATEKITRYEKKYPGELGHIDGYYLPKAYSFGKQRYLMGLIDDCTRIAYAEVVDRLNSWNSTAFLHRALSWFYQIYGIQFDGILNDNGMEYGSRSMGAHPFSKALEELGIKQYFCRPYRPQTNGKIEAFWKILDREFIKYNHFESIDEIKEQLGGFLYDYNHLRRHGGLKYITPFDKLKNVSELLS